MKKQKNEVKISIVIPIYNADKYLTKCLESVKQQTYDNFEVIMINDGSTDSSEEICSGFVTDKRFELYNQENQGVSVARNNGITKCNGTYIAFIDSDDFIKEDYFENLVNACDGEPDLIVSGIVYHNEYKIKTANQNQKRIPLENADKNRDLYKQYLNELSKRIPEPCFGAPYGKLYNKKVIFDNNLKFEIGQNLAEDLVFNLKFLQYTRSINVTDYSGYYYRMFVTNSLSRILHDYSYTKKRWEMVVGEYKKLYNKDICGIKERITVVAESNIRLSILNDKKMNISQKKKAFEEINQTSGNRQIFWIKYIKNMGMHFFKMIYRGAQVLVFNIRRIKR